MNKTVKILSIVLMVAIMTAFASTTVMAKDIIDQMSNVQTNTDTTGIVNVGGNLISIITTVGIVVAVIVLLILGIKYMMGSASEKAEYKKTMIPYLVGAVLIFGASAIAKAVIGLAGGIIG